MWADGGPYERWSTALRRWGAGEQSDLAGLPPLAGEDFSEDQWLRLANHLADALSKRLDLWSAALARAIGEATDEFGVARALTQARAGLRPIRAAAAHPGLPADLATKFLELVDTQVRSMQQSLEKVPDEMRRSGTDAALAELRRRTIRESPLTAQAPQPWLGPAEPLRRRVIPPQ
jgi:hypothetical protein